MPLTKLLNAFIGQFVLSTGLLTPVAMQLMAFLLGIELSIVGVHYMIDHELNPRPLIAKCMTVTVLSFCIVNWPWFIKTSVRMWVGWGLTASQGVMTENDFLDPDNIVKYGFAATGVVFQHLAQYSAWEQIKNIVEVWFSGGTAFLTLMVYVFLAGWVMISLLEFYAGAVVVMVTLPWGVSSTLSFIAEKGIGYLVASGIRLFVLAYILAIALPVLVTVQQTAPTNLNIPLLGPNFVQAIFALIGAIGLGMLSWRAGAFALGFTYGGPQLAPRDVTQFVNLMVSNAQRLGGAIDAMTERLGIGETPGRRI